MHKCSATYWEGKADSDSLQRIYAVSFPDKNRMKVHCTCLRLFSSHLLFYSHAYSYSLRLFLSFCILISYFVSLVLISDSLVCLLQEHKHLLAEAAKRDHRKIGRDQDLFFFHELSPGSAFFTPRGARIHRVLQEMITEQYRIRGVACTPFPSPGCSHVLSLLWSLPSFFFHLLFCFARS